MITYCLSFWAVAGVRQNLEGFKGVILQRRIL